MASIRTAIELEDKFTAAFNRILSTVNQGLSVMGNLNQAMGASVDTTVFDNATQAAQQATQAATQTEAAMQAVEAPTAEISQMQEKLDSAAQSAQKINEAVQTVKVPAQWRSGGGMEIFSNTGIERFEQEIQSANRMMGALNQTQERIAITAAQTEMFPPDAIVDMQNMQNRLLAIQQRIQQIESNPLSMGADAVNAELEQLRVQLSQAIQEQGILNRAVDNMDVQAANEAYLLMSRTVSDTERYIRDSTNQQEQFNQKIQRGSNEASHLTSLLKGALASYVSIQSIGKVLNISDQLTGTTARLSLMNDGLQTTVELQDMIYQSAERSRGSYQATATAVSKLGILAGDAFDNNQEVIDFMEQVNKQFAIAGTEAAGMDAAMLQLTQAMGSGVLRGEELNSVFEQAPTIIQTIADYLDVPIGQIRNMASEGEITAEIVKEAMFAAADETNAKFESMPKTFDQIWTSFQNSAVMSFQPVFDRLQDISNSPAFDDFVDNAVEGLTWLADVAVGVVDAMVNGVNFVADNWNAIAPILYTVGAGYVAVKAATLLYNGVLTVQNTIQLASVAIDKLRHGNTIRQTAAILAQTAATQGATAAQTAFNVVANANPIGLTIGIIGGAIAALTAFCALTNDAASEEEQLTAVCRKQEAELADMQAEYELTCEKCGENSDAALKLSWQIEDLTAEYEAGRQTVAEYEELMKAATQAHEEAVSGYYDMMNAIESEAAMVDYLTDRLMELENAPDTSATRQEIDSIIDKINELSGTKLTYDVNTGTFGFDLNNLPQITEEQSAAKSYEAYKDYLENTLYKNLEEQQGAAGAAKAEYEALLQEFDVLNANGGWVSTDWRDYLYIDEIASSEKVDKFDELKQRMALNDEIDAARNDWYEKEGEITETQGLIQQATKKMAEYERKMHLSELGTNSEYAANFHDAFVDVSNDTYTAAEAAEAYNVEIEQLNGALDITQTAEQIAQLKGLYQELRDTAADSINGQYEVWDTAAEVSATSVTDVNDALASQQKYWEDYNQNIRFLRAKDNSIEGLDNVVAAFGDGSAESVNMIAGMVSASNDELQQMVDNYR